MCPSGERMAVDGSLDTVFRDSLQSGHEGEPHLTDAIKTTSTLADIRIRSNKRFSGGATGAFGRTLCKR